MPSYNRLGSKAEEAAATHAATLTLTGSPTITKGRDDASKNAEALVYFTATVQEEEPIGTGNYFVTLSAVIKSIAANGETGHNTRVAEIGDMMSDDGLAATLSAAVSDFYCFAALELNGSGPEVEGDYLTETISRRLYACSRDIT